MNPLRTLKTVLVAITALLAPSAAADETAGPFQVSIADYSLGGDVFSGYLEKIAFTGDERFRVVATCSIHRRPEHLWVRPDLDATVKRYRYNRHVTIHYREGLQDVAIMVAKAIHKKNVNRGDLTEVVAEPGVAHGYDIEVYNGFDPLYEPSLADPSLDFRFGCTPKPRVAVAPEPQSKQQVPKKPLCFGCPTKKK